MAVPFLSLYLTQNLGFTLENVGSTMTSFGWALYWVLGPVENLQIFLAIIKVMFVSLVLTGFLCRTSIGGLLIASIGYKGLFWANGVTCILAGLLLLLVLHHKRVKVSDDVLHNSSKSAYADIHYLIFIIAMKLFAFAFLQYFSTVPIYYNQVHSLTELQIGLLLALNGFTIFGFEMPLIRYLENRPWSKLIHVLLGLVLVALSFLSLNFFRGQAF